MIRLSRQLRRLVPGVRAPFCQAKKDPEYINAAEEERRQEEKDTKSSYYIYGVSALGLTMGYFYLKLQEMQVADKSKSKKVFHTGKADIGGEWELERVGGQRFGSKDLKGSYYLIYFGFCNCPDICPNSLHKLSKAIEKLKSSEVGHVPVKTVFVSVDPDRDTPQKLEKWLSFFSKDIIAVTGRSNSDPELKETMKKFKIYASRIEYDDEQTKKRLYTLDHTILTYLMDQNSDYITHLGSNLSETDLLASMVEHIKADQQLQLQRLKTI